MEPIRIAVGTTDGLAVSEHLARSSWFEVFEVVEGKVAGRTVRGRETDACESHKSFVELLEGCRAVLCGGIGQGAFDALTAHGIQPLVLAKPGTVEEAVGQYLAGTLVSTDERICLCGH